MRVAGHSTNAADSVQRVVRASVSMHEWDYLYSLIKKSLTVPAYLVMIEV